MRLLCMLVGTTMRCNALECLMSHMFMRKDSGQPLTLATLNKIALCAIHVW